MKLSKETITVLKNFANINPGIVFSKGNILKTISLTETTLAEQTIHELFPVDFAIANLKKFLGILGLFADSPELVFNENSLSIQNGNTKLTYVYSNKDYVKAVTKSLVVPPPVVRFNITSSEIETLIQTGTVLQVPTLKLDATENKVVLTVMSLKDKSLGNFSMELNATLSEKSGTVTLTLENLQLLQEDYVVEISEKSGIYVSKFIGKNGHYFIVCDIDSSSLS